MRPRQINIYYDTVFGSELTRLCISFSSSGKTFLVRSFVKYPGERTLLCDLTLFDTSVVESMEPLALPDKVVDDLLRFIDEILLNPQDFDNNTPSTDGEILHIVIERENGNMSEVALSNPSSSKNPNGKSFRTLVCSLITTSRWRLFLKRMW